MTREMNFETRRTQSPKNLDAGTFLVRVEDFTLTETM